ncbi:Alpha/Beta hydrolase protein [Lipomyces oligophaga]|uniref:Alpha/Beta hydrolase protein n=1 Tax=Lipomyces oligophaga TaxID=45792 RepID=UPI0034CF0C3D
MANPPKPTNQQPQIPKNTDFQNATVSVTTPSSGSLQYALILLHGLGDTNANFTVLANRLNLPSTVVLALQAPKPMPFDLGGFHWGDDLVFSRDDQGSEELSPDAEFGVARAYIESIIRTLINNCGFSCLNIMLWGYGQGGMAALDYVCCCQSLRAVVSVGGWLPSWIKPRDILPLPRPTRILLCGGITGSQLSNDRCRQISEIFTDFSKVLIPSAGDLMPRNRDEMSLVLHFLLEIILNPT